MAASSSLHQPMGVRVTPKPHLWKHVQRSLKTIAHKFSFKVVKGLPGGSV